MKHNYDLNSAWLLAQPIGGSYRDESQDTGQMTTKRSVIRLIDNDHNDMTTYMIGPDGNEFRNMEITFERA